MASGQGHGRPDDGGLGTAQTRREGLQSGQGGVRPVRQQPGVRVVVSGHSHKPRVEERDGVLYVNPGSAGPRRFTLPIALGELKITRASVRARIQEL